MEKYQIINVLESYREDYLEEMKKRTENDNEYHYCNGYADGMKKAIEKLMAYAEQKIV
jgi:hypothetical protein